MAFALLFACFFGTGTAAGGDNGKHCDPSPVATPLAIESASAGVIANFSNRAGSIRAASKNMLTSAIETASSGEPMQRIIFKSIPEFSKKSSNDDQMCERYEKTTMNEPLEFNDKHFATVDELTDWIMDFTQGKGVDGTSLYKQCPGKCSPQYTWWIDPDKTELLVQARVVCGLPRDRDSDKYQLSTELTPLCPVADTQ